MCPPVSTDLRETVESLSLPQRFAYPLIVFGEQIIRRLQPQCIILYGSLARDTYTVASDIDLVIVTKGLSDSFHERLAQLQELNETRRSIDAFPYAPQEFETMLRRGHVTALDAVSDGVPLYGDTYFQGLKDILEDMVQRGLHRTSCSWVLPVQTEP